jgi:GNAT superfamily N-acetyltransferase
MTAIRIRTAGPDDMAAVLRLIRELARFEKAEDQVRATEGDLRRDGFGPQPRFEVLLAECVEDLATAPASAPEPIGFALFFHSYSTWEGRPSLYVEDLYVAEAARGLGAGRKLLAALAALALARDCRRLELSVLHWNPARDFYAALGFGQLSEWRPYRLAGTALSRLAAEATV